MKSKITILSVLIASCMNVYAGNKDRSGQGAAAQLLVNPWAVSGGVFGLNAACTDNVEAMKVNIAGLANVKHTDVGLSYNKFLLNYGGTIVNAAAAVPMGSRGTIGANIMSINMGDIAITNENNPSGNIGMFKPSIFNASIGYGHRFDKNINGGLNFTFLSEGVSNAKAGAVALDAGIQYTAGDRDNVHFGVVLRNVGSNMRFTGDGLNFSSLAPDAASSDKTITVSSKSDRFQLPTQLNIAGAYDIYFGNTAADNASKMADTNIDGKKVYGRSRLTLMGSFISNSFNSDYLGIGAEYAFKEQFFLRAGFRNEQQIFSATDNRTIYLGVSAGAGARVKYGSKGGSLQFDYAYKPTRMFSGVHTFGLRFVQ